MDWHGWHEKYSNPDSPLARRLLNVKEQIANALDTSPPGDVRIISLCAGQGRDVLEVLADHPRSRDVWGRLVELDERNTSAIKEKAESLDLRQLEVITGDAALTDHYMGIAPADLVIACGLFGNISDEDIQQTIETCAQLCKTGGVVIWTRNRLYPDKVPDICKWFEQRGFDREWLSDGDPDFGVGVHRLSGPSHELIAGSRMFTFIV